MLKVKDLIEQLQKLDQEAVIITWNGRDEEFYVNAKINYQGKIKVNEHNAVLFKNGEIHDYVDIDGQIDYNEKEAYSIE